MKYPTATAYLASYVLVRNGHKIAFLLRGQTGWMDDHYGLPAGKVEKDESFAQAAIREAKEEIGIIVETQDLKQVLIMQRKEEPDQENLWIDVFFEALKYKGKPYNAEPNVHQQLAWFDPSNLPKNMIPSVRFAIGQVTASNSYCEFGFDN